MKKSTLYKIPMWVVAILATAVFLVLAFLEFCSVSISKFFKAISKFIQRGMDALADNRLSAYLVGKVRAAQAAENSIETTEE